jgi:hypothetical protein
VFDTTGAGEPVVAERTDAIVAVANIGDDLADVRALHRAARGRVGFMVAPETHYGPNVNGYEYSARGTYHFADRYGVGVDRSVATGSGFTAQ